MKKEKCPAYDYECPYCDEWGYCELENPETECDDFIENILYEDVQNEAGNRLIFMQFDKSIGKMTK